MTATPTKILSRRAVLKSGAMGTALAAGRTSPSSAQAVSDATFVLVHPAWLGGWCWKKVAPLLRASGCSLHAPTLTGLGERRHLLDRDISLETHVQDVVAVLEAEDLRDVILVGNSSGGVVITAVAHRVPERLAQLVYLDAFVPQDGQSLLDLLPADRGRALAAFVEAEGEGWLLPRFAPLPWDRIARDMWGVTSDDDLAWMLPRLGPTPFKHFTVPVAAANPAAASLARTYVRCVQYQLGSHPAFDGHAAMARETPGWRHRDLEAPHLPFITNPAELVDVLIELAA